MTKQLGRKGLAMGRGGWLAAAMDVPLSKAENHRDGVLPLAAEALRRRRMAVLLATLVLLILASPLADQSPASRLVIVAVAIAFFLAGLQRGGRSPRMRGAVLALALAWLVLNMLTAAPGFAWARGVGLGVLAMLVLANLGQIAKAMLSARVVDAELLCSAFGGYLAIGVFWAASYGVVTMVAPGVFAVSGGGALSQGTLMYFSFTTLTTTGFGDVVAVDPFLRMWVILEAIVGTMYSATVIARLVSLYGREFGQKGA